MSANPRNALLVAVEMAERQRDAARHSLHDAQAGALAAQEQMAQLETYAAETDARWGMRAGASLAPEVLFHHRHFMGRLEHAMQLQSRVLADHAQRVAGSERALIAAQVRLATLKKLVAKRQRELELVQQRREQKQTDERALLAQRLRFDAH
ncbi:MAG: flagellar FliJ family protein [Giesbergeria sp.]|jgi:flagellar FliJ protein|nr:flagellar FliJ family protein [Simplicispira sp.]